MRRSRYQQQTEHLATELHILKFEHSRLMLHSQVQETHCQQLREQFAGHRPPPLKVFYRYLQTHLKFK